MLSVLLTKSYGRLPAFVRGGWVVLGRRSFQAVARPVPGCNMVVVSRKPPAFEQVYAVEPDGESTILTGAADLDCLLRMAARGLYRPEVFVVGGHSLFAAALPLASRLYLDGPWKLKESSRSWEPSGNRGSFAVFERRYDFDHV